MRKTTIALALTLLVLAGASALAQQPSMCFDVPFGFTANGDHYAAGLYDARLVANHVLLLRNRATGDAALLPLAIAESGAGDQAWPPRVDGRRGYLLAITDQSGINWRVRGKVAYREALRAQPGTVVLAMK